MRDSGIPADVMTIDCLKTKKQIIIVLHDGQPEIVSYQFSHKDKIPSTHFETLVASELNSKILFDWIKNYFRVQTH